MEMRIEISAHELNDDGGGPSATPNSTLMIQSGTSFDEDCRKKYVALRFNCDALYFVSVEELAAAIRAMDGL